MKLRRVDLGTQGVFINSVSIHPKYSLWIQGWPGDRTCQLLFLEKLTSCHQFSLFQDLGVLRAGLQGESWATVELMISPQSRREESGGGRSKDLNRGFRSWEDKENIQVRRQDSSGMAVRGSKGPCRSDWLLSWINPLDPLKEYQEQFCEHVCVFPGLSLEACKPLASHSHGHARGKHVAEEEGRGWKWGGNTWIPLCSAVRQARWPVQQGCPPSSVGRGWGGLRSRSPCGLYGQTDLGFVGAPPYTSCVTQGTRSASLGTSAHKMQMLKSIL